jgi:starch-binding outer membrane protein, SusD/RagB family
MKPGKISPSDFGNYSWQTPFDVWGLYTTIRKENEFLVDVKASKLPAATTNLRAARIRWARAFCYFILARNLGGVPLITTPQSQTDPKDSLYPARNTEIQIYDFCLNELNDIIGNNALPAVKFDNGNPTLYEALALKSQIALYAGNIAKWGTMDLNGILGVPSSRAADLYQSAYDAAKQIVTTGPFTLFNGIPGDKAENFRQLFLTKQNSEVIFSKELNGPVQGVGGNYDEWESPVGLVGGWPGNATQAYFEMAEEFEWVNGTPGVPGTFDLTALQSQEWTYDQLWKNKDPRFFATLYTHGTTFQNTVLQMNQDILDVNGNDVQTAGVNYNPGLNTGFGVLKYLNDALIKPQGGQSTTDNIVHRLGEMLLDYAEAAFELGKTSDALTAVNLIRARAGLTALSSITRDNIRHERKVEMAFENGDRYYSLKSWRLSTDLLSRQYSGLQYTNDLKTGLFKVTVLPNADGTQPPLFTQKNYYNPLTVAVTTNNPNLVENPY